MSKVAKRKGVGREGNRQQFESCLSTNIFKRRAIKERALVKAVEVEGEELKKAVTETV